MSHFIRSTRNAECLILLDFAKDYNISFNASKSKLMYFGKDNVNCENLLCMSNGSSIKFVEQCVHLGTKIYSDISMKNIDSATNAYDILTQDTFTLLHQYD